MKLFSFLPLGVSQNAFSFLSLRGRLEFQKIKIPFLSARAERLKIEERTDLFNRAVKASQNFQVAKKNGEATEEELKELKEASAKLAEEILTVSNLIQVNPEYGDALYDQIIANEKVHPIEDHSDLLTHRLGMAGANKDCQALVVETTEGLKILAQIFRYHVHVPVNEGVISPRDLPGDVDKLKTSDIAHLQGDENLTGYWTVSSAWPGSGAALIARLPQNRSETTISPVRGFTSGYVRNEIFGKSDDDLRYEVMRYLDKGEDPIMKFHLGNGAYIGWIHINHDAPKESKDWVTINYIYDRELLEQNKSAFNKGELPKSPELQEIYEAKQYRVTRPLYAPQNAIQ